MKTKNLFYILLTAFIISLIPLYIIGIYAHPSVDDYYYGAATAAVWSQTHSLTAVISASFQAMVDTYYDWQGNFSAIFLMRLQPGIFDENFYFITPFLLITTFVLCSIFFFYTALKYIYKCSSYLAGSISLCITFVSMQLTSVPSDSFYWFNGSIYYTFFYSLMLLLFGIMICMRHKKSGILLVIMQLCCIILAFFIGGSNYATALFTAIILSLTAGNSIYYVLRRKNTQITGWHSLFYTLTALACLAGLFISITAPGNVIRQASVGGSTGLIKTFLYTFAYGGYSLANVLSAPCLIFFLTMIPVFYHISKKVPFEYPMPLFILIFTFGLYCSAGTPVFYAQGLRIPYRLSNIIYFSAYSFLAFNLIYTCGWIRNRFEGSSLLKNAELSFYSFLSNRKKAALGILLCLAAFLVACVGGIKVSETEYSSGKAAFSNMPMSISALYSLLNGDAYTYDKELDERAAYLASSDETNVAVLPLSARPELIFHTDITTDPVDWRNAHLSIFYHKNSIYLEYE